MRKYRIPKVLYAILAMILLFLAVDYTYAYFSAKISVSGELGVADISIQWYRTDGTNYTGFSTSNVETIDISEIQLKRANYTAIKYNGSEITLLLSPTIETPVYCRVKLEATYTNSSKKTVDCSEFIKLAYNNTLIENSTSWKFENGYYYYKSGSTLTEITNGNAFSVANQLYLDQNSSSEMYGKDLVITLTAQIVQSSYGGAEYEWGI